ncbi:putative DNA-binding transcriptional regulator YafY [Bacilli bacterium PM5-3]|nr:putative DNA-binding transcriptional regulator YafY [Bacilli bacterium PM5-3]MDH6603058.1 putative DNA-binding transcriptional regulator YafY [Bacilli bacterium PM5-9]
MSTRVANSIKMLEILRDGRKYKKNELAQLLQTNPRNIIEYRKDLYDAGYNIEYQNGTNGGYYLDSACLLPSVNLSNNEKTALLRSYDFLKNSDFFHLKNYYDALIKIKANFDSSNLLHESYINQARPVDIDLIDNYYKVLSNAISMHRKVSLKYESINSDTIKKTIIHPYELIRYQNFWYLIARDESSDKQFKIYKLSKRMKELTILEDKPFYFDEDFKASDYIGKTSLIKLERFEIELIATGASAVSLSEKKIGLDPVYDWVDQNTLCLKTTIEGKYNAIGLILSLGNNAKLVKPQSLVDEIKKIIEKMHNIYIDSSHL